MIKKTLISIILAAVPASAMAGNLETDRAGNLPPIDAGTIWNQIQNSNPFPQPAPTTLDYCLFTEFRNNKCFFKCQSGAVLTEPAQKPDFSTGEPAGACATHIIRPMPAFPYKSAAAAEQTYDSRAKYPTAQKASEVMNWAVNGLKFAKAEVTGQTIVVSGLADYGFRITYRAASPLLTESSPLFRAELDAYERMFDMADRLEADGAVVATHEVVNYGADGYYYVIGYFEGEGDDSRRAAKKIKACWLKTAENDTCGYKCTGGTTYSQPMQRPNPWDDQPVVPCPQLVFPF